MMIVKVTKTALAVAGALALILPGAAMARGSGGGGMHGGMGAGMGMAGGNSASHISANGMANTNGPNATDQEFGTTRASLRHQKHATNANATTSAGANAELNGGQSSTHISGSGLANTNGPNATDRETGTARATQRTQMNAHSSTNANVPHN